MTNQKFCYWLQGYFEIGYQINLTKEKINLIQQQLNLISEPLGNFTQWLKELFFYLEQQDYNQSLLNYFLKEIRDQLNLVFYHVIDNRYETEFSPHELKQIHDGLTHDQ